MSPLSPDNQFSLGLEERLSESRQVSWRNLGKKMIFYAPSFYLYRNPYFQTCRASFPSISLTGTDCALQCEHCKTRLLEGMIPATSPQDLKKVLEEIARKGSAGCLISGGCEAGGSVQLASFLPTIARAKADLGLRIVVHTGLTDSSSAMRLAKSGIDCALIDIIGSRDTAHDVYHLDIEISRYEESLAALRNAGVKTVPHVTIGLDYGKLKGEYQAIEMISRYDPAATVIIVLTPMKKTKMEGLMPPKPEEVINVLIRARELMPKTPLLLGCARPTGAHRILTERLAIEAGVNGIAFPASSSIELARRQGIQCYASPHCCALIYADLEDKSLTQLG